MRARLLIGTVMPLMLFASIPCSVASAGTAWAAREHVDWFKSRYSCFVGAAVDVGPRGRAFVATTMAIDNTHSDLRVSAHRGSNGDLVWRRRFDVARTEGAEDVLFAAGTVFVLGTAGELSGKRQPRGLLIYAFGASHGSLLWSRLLRGPDGRAEAASMTLSPNGRRIYVAGTAYRTTSTDDLLRSRLLVAALDVDDGSTIWKGTPPGPDPLADQLYGCDGDHPIHAVTATADAVVVALEGQIAPEGEGSMTTVALNASTGSVRWWNSLPGLGEGDSVVATPDGATVIAGGNANRATFVAYDVSTGRRLWRRTMARRIETTFILSGDGRRLYAAGSALGPVVWTASLRAVDGALAWERFYQDRDTYHGPSAIAMGPDGRHAYVATWRCVKVVDDPHNTLPACERDYAVLRYRAVGGRGGMWRTHGGPYAPGSETTTDLAVSPSARVVVTGLSQVGPAPNVCGKYVCKIDYDVATVAFR